KKNKQKTYGSWDSLVVTHLTTNQPVRGLCMAERTGCPILRDLWSYVPNVVVVDGYILRKFGVYLVCLR
ncbi:hypothetical protein K452DRAFT_220258, partial [Aplosporella prunicola CBS 121167]